MIIREYPPLTLEDVQASVAYAAALSREEGLIPLRGLFATDIPATHPHPYPRLTASPDAEARGSLEGGRLVKVVHFPAAKAIPSTLETIARTGYPLVLVEETENVEISEPFEYACEVRTQAGWVAHRKFWGWEVDAGCNHVSEVRFHVNGPGALNWIERQVLGSCPPDPLLTP